MYEAATKKELKKLLEENKLPIKIIDRELEKEVIRMEKKANPKNPVIRDYEQRMGEICTSTIVLITIILTILSATSIALYAIYKKRNVKVSFAPDGSVVVESKEEKQS